MEGELLPIVPYIYQDHSGPRFQAVIVPQNIMKMLYEMWHHLIDCLILGGISSLFILEVPKSIIFFYKSW